MNERVKEALESIFQRFKEGYIPEAIAFSTLPIPNIPAAPIITPLAFPLDSCYIFHGDTPFFPGVSPISLFSLNVRSGS